MSNVLVQQQMVEIVQPTHMSFPENKNLPLPALLVRYDGNSLHKFIHYNFTMFRCVWGYDMVFTDKVDAFRDMSEWIGSYNETLNGVFADPEDYLAWHVAHYVDPDEFHVD